jgi:hypothetical protein
VAQEIEPTTKWFFGLIEPESGISRIEEKAFKLATYGRQLGLITELLLDIASKSNELSVQARESKARLEILRSRIENVKQEEYREIFKELIERLSKLKQASPENFKTIESKLASLLE